MRIDIFSDVVCPWCYLGARRFSAALERVGPEGIEVHWRAFQLDPAAHRSRVTCDARSRRSTGPVPSTP